jgi:phosphatidate cytidylyltransferase
MAEWLREHFAGAGMSLPPALVPAWMLPRMPKSESPQANGSKKQVFIRRSVSTVGLWVGVAGAIATRQAWAYAGVVGVFAVVASAEYFQMLRKAGVRGHGWFGVLVSAAYSLALAWGYIGGGRLAGGGGLEAWQGIDVAAVFFTLAGAFVLEMRQPIRGPDAVMAVAANVFGFVYVAYLFHFSERIVFLVPGSGQVPGALALLWLVAVTKFTDMGAYITGTLIGRHKMMPTISPAKTWEGFAGALAFAQLAGCGLYALFPGRQGLGILGGWPHVIALGLVVALLSVIGDLAESVVKRSLGAKDSGAMLPGIGGALDLIDSLCFTAPVMYVYLKWILP